MISQSHECQTNEVSGAWLDSIEHLIRWIGPRTVGRERVFQRMADVRKAQRETHRLQDALCLLSRELDALYPQGAVISLARRRVRDVALTLAHT
ncbi:MAG TPA: hypothetical protein VIK60_10320 [Vicinamibacterales bacterium]